MTGGLTAGETRGGLNRMPDVSVLLFSLCLRSEKEAEVGALGGRTLVVGEEMGSWELTAGMERFIVDLEVVEDCVLLAGMERLIMGLEVAGD